MTDDDLVKAVSKALRRAYNLGQTFWQQADNHSRAQHKKADETQATFNQLVEEVKAQILSHVTPPPIDASATIPINRQRCEVCAAEGCPLGKCRYEDENPPVKTPPRFPVMLRKMWSGREVQEWLNNNWKGPHGEG